MKILLVSHGYIAKSVSETLRDLFGLEDISYASVSLDNGISDLESGLNLFFDKCNADEIVIICSDLKAGSANQIAMRYLKRSNTYLISGMNLVLILQLALMNDFDREKLKQIIENSKQDICLMNEISYELDDEDE